MNEVINNIAEQLADVQEMNAELKDFLSKNLIISGKTMKQWSLYLHIEIPEDVDLHTLAKLSTKVARNYQEASRFRDGEDVQLRVLQQAKSDKYHQTYSFIRNKHQEESGKQLSAESCKVEATLAVKDIENAINHQRVVASFWKGKCDTLVEIRKLLENIGKSLGTDAYLNREFTIRSGN